MNNNRRAIKWAPDASSTQLLRLGSSPSSTHITGIYSRLASSVLSENDIYLLETELEVNPILSLEREKYRLAYLMFDLVNGTTLHKGAKLQGIPGKDEPATLPRVSELVVVSRDSPWTTTIRNEQGVTVGDVWIGIFKDYYEHNLADHEFNSLTARASEILRRTSLLHKRSDLLHVRDNVSRSATHQQCWNIDDWTIADRFRRIDCFRHRIYFKGLVRDDHYIQERQGFRLSNMFVMELNSQ